MIQYTYEELIEAWLKYVDAPFNKRFETWCAYCDIRDNQPIGTNINLQ